LVLSKIVPFLAFNLPGLAFPRIKAFFQALRQEEAVDLPIGAAGFCWGGKLAVMMACNQEKTAAGKRLLDAIFLGHPSMLKLPDEIEKSNLPASFALGEKDTAITTAQIEEIKRIIEAKPEGQKGEVIIYEGAGHGFCIRADLTVKDVAKQAAEAEDQCIKWFNIHFGLTS
jgi:dienelactone hydrolase